MTAAISSVIGQRARRLNVSEIFAATLGLMIFSVGALTGLAVRRKPPK
jgi:hypothetical protein